MCDPVLSGVLIGQLASELECQVIRLTFSDCFSGNGLGMRLVTIGPIVTSCKNHKNCRIRNCTCKYVIGWLCEYIIARLGPDYWVAL